MWAASGPKTRNLAAFLTNRAAAGTDEKRADDKDNDEDNHDDD